MAAKQTGLTLLRSLSPLKAIQSICGLLLVNAPGEKSDAVPLLPKLIPAAAIAPESPNIFPADTELFVTMSLDLPQVYAAMSKPVSMPQFVSISTGQ